MKKHTLLLLFVLFCSHLYAVEGRIVNTVNYSLSDAWYKIPQDSLPVIVTTQTVFQDEYFILTIFLDDYAIDANNNVNVVYDLTIHDPNNKVVFSQKSIPGFINKVYNSKSILKTSTDMKISFEKDKPTGKYTMKVIFHDNVSKKGSTAEGSINVIKYKYKKYFTSDDQFYAWMDNYYQQPSPEKIIDGFLYYTTSKLNEKDTAFVPDFTFFLNLFNNNKYLLPIIKGMYEEQGLQTKIYLINLFNFVDYDMSTFLNGLKGEYKKVYYENKGKKYVADPYGELTTPTQLDALWGEFRATGSYKPVEQVIRALNITGYTGAIDKFRKSDTKTDTERTDALKEATYQAAVWSLGKKNRNKNLVMDYCAFALTYDKTLTDKAREDLKSILYGK